VGKGTRWLPLDMQNSVVLEMCFPSDSITFSFAEYMENRPYQTHVSSRKEQIFLEEKSTASFLSSLYCVSSMDKELLLLSGTVQSNFVQTGNLQYLDTSRVEDCQHALLSLLEMKLLTFPLKIFAPFLKRHVFDMVYFPCIQQS
jgi:hypothetical protein